MVLPVRLALWSECMLEVDCRDNLHGVEVYGHGLAVECTACGHRAVITIGRRGDMTQIYDLKLRCQGCRTAGRFKAWLPVSAAEATAFLTEKPAAGA
jgi:hypothetical protein